MSSAALLEVRGLQVRFDSDAGIVRAVNDVSYVLEAGRSLALVGESGSGKSASVLALLGLLPPGGSVAGGSARFERLELLSLPASELRQLRGRRIGIVFQDPSTSLNPVLTIGCQLGEGMRQHLGLGAGAARERAITLLTRVGIPAPEARLGDYPHQFSGGQRQRVVIAMALACQPSLLIADEPTTALDVTVQAQIVELLRSLRESQAMALLWITHDLGLAATLADSVAVMYAGYVVERAPARDLFAAPRHPYTAGLLEALPGRARGRGGLAAIPGAPPDLRQDFRACPFAPRCPYVVDRCRQENPPLLSVAPGRESACWRWQDL